RCAQTAAGGAWISPSVWMRTTGIFFTSARAGKASIDARTGTARAAARATDTEKRIRFMAPPFRYVKRTLHPHAILEQRARDHQALDLRGSLVDLHHPGIAAETLDRVVLHVTVSAVHLDRLMRHPGRGFARVELGHRGLARIVHPGVAHPCRTLGQEP